MKKLFYFFTFVVSVFLFSNTVFATTIGQVSDSGTNEIGTCPSAGNCNVYIFTPDVTQTINAITVNSSDVYTGALYLVNSSGTVIATSTNLAGAGIQTVSIPFTTLTAGAKYGIRGATGNTNFYTLGSSYNGATDLYVAGCRQYTYTAGNALGTCGVGNTQLKADWYLSVSNIQGVTPFISASSTIAVNGAVNIGGVVSGFSGIKLKIRLYSMTANQTYYFDAFAPYLQSTTTIDYYVHPLAVGTYRLRYYSMRNDGDLTEITPVLPYNFTVSTSTNTTTDNNRWNITFGFDAQGNPLATSTTDGEPIMSEETCNVGTATTTVDVFFKKFGCFFLNPAPWAKAGYLNELSEVQNTFPFSLVFGSVGAVKDSLSDVSSTGTDTLNFTYKDGDMVEHNIAFLSPTVMVDTIGQTWKDFIFTVLNATMWVGTGWLIISFIL